MHKISRDSAKRKPQKFGVRENYVTFLLDKQSVLMAYFSVVGFLS